MDWEDCVKRRSAPNPCIRELSWMIWGNPRSEPENACPDSEFCLGPAENQARMCGYGNNGAIKMWWHLSVRTNLGGDYYFLLSLFRVLTKNTNYHFVILEKKYQQNLWILFLFCEDPGATAPVAPLQIQLCRKRSRRTDPITCIFVLLECVLGETEYNHEKHTTIAGFDSKTLWI
jgi:hypothetical protein